MNFPARDNLVDYDLWLAKMEGAEGWQTLRRLVISYYLRKE